MVGRLKEGNCQVDLLSWLSCQVIREEPLTRRSPLLDFLCIGSYDRCIRPAERRLDWTTCFAMAAIPMPALDLSEGFSAQNPARALQSKSTPQLM